MRIYIPKIVIIVAHISGPLRNGVERTMANGCNGYSPWRRARASIEALGLDSMPASGGAGASCWAGFGTASTSAAGRQDVLRQREE